MPSFRYRMRGALNLAALGAIQLLLLSGCAGTGIPRQATFTPITPIAGEEAVSSAELAPTSFNFEWPDDPRLRSAGYARDHGLDRDGALSPADEVRELRGHFAAVIGWLEDREDASLASAIARLEKGRGRAFDVRERAAERARLQTARRRQIETLEAYAAAGRFPLNTATDGVRRPIFVDANDTACAVGHLMQEDGYRPAVEAIRRNDLFVYLPDVKEGPVLAWVAESGLLHEEAAVIQPGYAPPPGPGNLDLAGLAPPGAVAEAGGLRFENFSARRIMTEIDLPAETLAGLRDIFPDLSLGELATLLNLDLTTTETPFPSADLGNVSTHVQTLYYDENGGSLESLYGPSSPFLFWNASNAGGFLDDSSGLFGLFGTEIAFDVSVVELGMGIDAAAFGVANGFWGDAGGFGPDLELEMEVRNSAGQTLATYSINGLGPLGGCCSIGGAFEEHEFAAQERVSVLVRGSRLPESGPVYWSQFQQDFRIVPIPEPTSTLLISLGLIVLAARRRFI